MHQRACTLNIGRVKWNSIRNTIFCIILNLQHDISQPLPFTNMSGNEGWYVTLLALSLSLSVFVCVGIVWWDLTPASHVYLLLMAIVAGGCKACHCVLYNLPPIADE